MKNNPLFLKVRAYNQLVLVAGFVVLFGGVFAMLILDATNWWNITLVLMGLAILGLFLAANLTEVKETGKKRGNVARAHLSLLAVAMFGIVCAVNYVVSRHPIRFDLTANKFFTLSPQTLEVLKGLKQEVRVTMFISPRRSPDEIRKATQLLQEYAKKSSKFHFKTVDIDKDPTEARRMGIREFNTVVFEAGTNRRDVLQKDYITYAMQGRQPVPKFQGEGTFTATLVKMGDTTQLSFYLVEGHGEKDMNNPQPDGMNIFKDMLEKQNYQVKTLNLLKTGKVPEDATVLGILGPNKTFQAAEMELLRRYLVQGGKLVICVDARIRTGLEPILKDYGIKLGLDVAVDPTSHNMFNAVEVIPAYVYHSIVEKLSQGNIVSLMPYCRSVQKEAPALKDVTQDIFLQTTDKGWGETDFAKKEATYQVGVDTKGPVPLAMACEKPVEGSPDKKSRIVVIGTSLFLENQYVQFYGNQDVAVNSFSWAALEENKIAIHPKEEDVRMVELSSASAKFILYFTIFVMPLSVLAAGVMVWYRRRSL